MQMHNPKSRRSSHELVLAILAAIYGSSELIYHGTCGGSADDNSFLIVRVDTDTHTHTVNLSRQGHKVSWLSGIVVASPNHILVSSVVEVILTFSSAATSYTHKLPCFTFADSKGAGL